MATSHLTIGGLRPRLRAMSAGTLLPAIAGLGGITFLLWLLDRGDALTFYFDEWDFVLGRQTWDADSLFAPHVGHLSVVPVLAYKGMSEAFGIWEYTPFRVLGLAVHGVVVYLVYRYARPRLGATPALVPALLILALGRGWSDILWPFQVGYVGSLAFGLGAFLALDRDDQVGDVVACALLTLSLGSSSVAIPIAGGIALELILTRTVRRRATVVVPPLLLYAAWYVSYRPQSQIDLSRIEDVPGFVTTLALASAGSLVGRGVIVGAGVLLMLAAVWFLGKRPRFFPVRAIVLAAIAVALWTLTAFARAGIESPDASRYLYPGALLIVLLTVELVRGRRIRPPASWGLAVVTALAIASSARAFDDGFVVLSNASALSLGAAAGLDLAGPVAPPELRPEPNAAPQLSAGAYRDVTRRFGTPAPQAEALSAATELTRQAADRTLVAAYGLMDPKRLVGPSGFRRPRLLTGGGSVRLGTSCITLAGGAPATLEIPPGGMTLDVRGTGRSTLAFARFATTMTPPVSSSLRAGNPVVLRIPQDGDRKPWRATVGYRGLLTACGAP